MDDVIPSTVDLHPRFHTKQVNRQYDSGSEPDLPPTFVLTRGSIRPIRIPSTTTYLNLGQTPQSVASLAIIFFLRLVEDTPSFLIILVLVRLSCACPRGTWVDCCTPSTERYRNRMHVCDSRYTTHVQVYYMFL